MPNLLANWPAPKHVHALTTKRAIGQSRSPYNHNNLALHVGDNKEQVLENRLHLSQSLLLMEEPVWLDQIHSNLCIVAEQDSNRAVDAAVTRQQNLPLVIMTADCLPIVICNQQGTEIAAIHAGWRGLADGIIENTLKKMEADPQDLIVWIGPAICQRCYEVGLDTRDTFVNRYPFTQPTFKNDGDHHYANLPKMAELILNKQRVNAVYLSEACSYELKNDFYSYRRDGQTGRMATLIWFNKDAK